MHKMRLKMILPVVAPEQISTPQRCPDGECGGRHFKLHQEVQKAVRDGQYSQVRVLRYTCMKCRHSFRVYPRGVSHAHVSQRVKGMAVMLYLLGLSYGAVALMLEALGVCLSKTSVYRAVQATAEKVVGLKRNQIVSGYQTKVIGADLTYVKCKGKWLAVGVIVDPRNGLVLSIDHLSGEDARTLQAWIEPIADQVGAQVLVSDDADAFKIVSDETGRSQQVCKSHVGRNTDALVENLSVTIRAGKDHSLETIGVSQEQALADLDSLKMLIHTRNPEEQEELEKMYLRYANARKPPKGKPFSVAYRMRNLFLDRWNLWPRLTFYRTWKDEHGNENLDGTNNHCERSIGWWVKERYRSMRGYKREQSALNVSRLIAFAGNHLSRGLDLASLIS